MEVIGLTGGIAAGKSAVAARLAELGAVIVDADRLAREAVAPGTPGLSAVVQRFGETVLDAEGALNRTALGAIIFGSEVDRRDLNAIVHPEVRRLYRERVEAIAASDPDAVVVYDVPLLAEARAADEFALVVVVDAPPDVRVERLVRLRGLDRAAAEARVAAQIPDAERRAMADIVIDSSGTLDATLEQVDAVWERLVAQRAVGGPS
ncbi:dephospho-CoA kinase [Yonghaparkia sp. Root332]|uniref:dephospho-CoA kinase n=1 Tax=Yonghaparkia sp. Root332 TaxID=1736516 RepID=UPI0006FA3A71|nr:dephospho-CoA kinase [Yonghaparkia sp. Root332]KQV25028.1 dephospho-CoA kinase [Yonghaparkia sp. Root332]